MGRITIPYKPREQFLSYHSRSERWAIIVAHRRFGKTVGCINDLIKRAITCEKENPRFAYIGPTYAQAKDVAWEYLKHYASYIPDTKINESELYIKFKHNNARIRLYGSDNYDRLRGGYLDGVVSDEHGDQDPRAWTEVIRPALSDRQGWATFIGTPRGQNHFQELWEKAKAKGWYNLILKASETGILPDEELLDARNDMSAEQYAAEYECSFAGSLAGAYYAKAITDLEKDGRTKGDWWRPDYPVHTAWDVGKTSAIWFFQVVEGRVLIVDFMEAVGQTAPWYADKLKAKKYSYGTHITPSDADDEKELAGYSWVDGLTRMGLTNFHVLPKQSSIDNGIQKFLNLLPRCYFDDNTTNGLKSLTNYHTKWDDKRKTFRDHPEHDWASHGADAARYLAIGIEEITKEEFKSEPISMDIGDVSFMGV